MQREELEKQAIDGFIVKIKQLETYKEFNVSKEEFYKILKKRMWRKTSPICFTMKLQIY
jgi:hypothetical protein